MHTASHPVHVLVTGASGLIGSATVPLLRRRAHRVTGLDLRGQGAEQGDTCNPRHLRRALQGVDGVIHLAAVSRVIDGERHPERCRTTNVQALQGLIELMAAMPRKPWLIFASSREVYGHTDGQPVSEDAPLLPVNVYGHSKVAGERLVTEARALGVRSQIVRFSNVYGTTDDHADRVVPAFARGAVRGQALRVDGSQNTFDFTHVNDSVAGLVALAERVAADAQALFPPIHFVTGQATSLGQLASLASGLGDGRSRVLEAPSRSFDVAHFRGNPARAKALLGWAPTVDIRTGLGWLMHDFSQLEAPPQLASQAEALRA